MSDPQANEAEKNVSCTFLPVFFFAAPPLYLTAPRSRSQLSQPQLSSWLTRFRRQIEIWKVKKLIKRLEAARGNGTSMISLIIRESALRCCHVLETAH